MPGALDVSPTVEVTPSLVSASPIVGPVATTQPAPVPATSLPSIPQPTSGMWPAPLPPEPALSRSPVTPAEQAAFEVLARTTYSEKDPIALAEAVKGVPARIEPIIAREVPILIPGIVQLFWVRNHDNNAWEQVEARLERITEHAYLWFDTSRQRLGERAYDQAAQAIEQVYIANRSVFGFEWNPGIDADPHVYIVHAGAGTMCAVTEQTTSQCDLLGFFSVTDELPVSVEPHSNQHELIIMNLDASEIGSQRYRLTLAHEFRHMIEYNYDRGEEEWEMEGTAVMAQELLGYPEVPAGYANSFTRGGGDLQLNAWSFWNAVQHYGKGYLFSRYLYHRLGPEFFSAWVQHPGHGLQAIDSVLETQELELAAHELWLDWAAAVSLIGKENLPQEYSFGEPFSVSPPTTILINTFPKRTATQVNQYGFDIYNLRGIHPLQVEFTGTTKVPLLQMVRPASGSMMWWSGRANQSSMTLTRAVDLNGVDRAWLNYSVYYQLEAGYDFAYVLVSEDGGLTWKPLSTPNMQGAQEEDDPAQAALANYFYTGWTGGWVEESLDLSPYAGKKILVRFQVLTDHMYAAAGLALDNLSIPEVGFFDDVESLKEGWQANGFTRAPAYLPQRFDLLLVTFLETGSPQVQRLFIAPNNTARFSLPLSQASDQAFLIVAASSPQILTPAAYELGFDTQ